MLNDKKSKSAIEYKQVRKALPYTIVEGPGGAAAAYNAAVEAVSVEKRVNARERAIAQFNRADLKPVTPFHCIERTPRRKLTLMQKVTNAVSKWFKNLWKSSGLSK